MPQPALGRRRLVRQRRPGARAAWAGRRATDFADGLTRTTAWYRGLENKDKYLQSSKKFGLDTKYSVTAIIACYKDNQAIPIMYQRLSDTFTKLNIEYEIIFVNDNSPDDSEEVIRGITRKDRRVIGISHSRNFGSQSAFRSGMEIASKNACVLLDGDLQDPPELIEQFVEKWREGYDVVYGRRVKREAPLLMQIAYKTFYRLFDHFSYLTIPHDAGDFSLMDRRVVQNMLQFPERDLFLRGVRAFVGFKQTGVDYVRPERMFGAHHQQPVPQHRLGEEGHPLVQQHAADHAQLLRHRCCSLLSILLMAVQIVAPPAVPERRRPRASTTVLIGILFFGSLNLFAIGLVGEYIAKIFEEVKQRPHFIRRSIIRDGEVRPAADAAPGPPA